jgi:oxygen-independent coproporphyrinogen III oxidase
MAVLDFYQCDRRARIVELPMLAQQFAAAERTVPRYTSYPTAPHFGPAVNAQTYGAWLESLPASAPLSLYLHVPFCEKLCHYCGCNTKAVRQAAPVDAYAAVLSREIDLVAARTGSRPISHLHWGGGTPSILGPDRLRSLVAALDVRFDLAPLLEHAIELDPRLVSRQLAGALVDIAVNRVSLGVQEFSADVQQAIGRVQPFEVVERAVGVLRDAGIQQINIDLMYGLPGQSAEDVRRSVILAHDLRPQRFAIFGYAHVPWFKPHQKLIDEAALPGAAARIAQARIAHETLTSLGYEPIGLDHYARPEDSLVIASRTGRLRRNFQGYTTDTAEALVGLGTSAIGQMPQGFAQNSPATGNYSRAIMAGELATVRGIALSADDRIRSRIISDIMCNMTCDLAHVADDHRERQGCLFATEIDELKPFVADGLVQIDGVRISVAEEGRPYLRLIAAAFDSYLAQSRARHSVAV